MRRHGTHSCYVGGCRCQPCRDAHAAYWRTNRKGYVRRVPAAPYAEVVRALVKPRITMAELSRLTGVPEKTIRALRDNHHETIFRTTAEKLRAVLPSLLPSEEDVA